MPIVRVVPCNYCLLDTTLPQPSLEEMVPSLVASPTGKETLDFVCPNCGNGSRHSISLLREIEIPYTPSPHPHGPPLFHVSLKCEKEGCLTHARVHTLAASEPSRTSPKIALSEWKLNGLTCYDGHPVKEPPEPLPNVLDQPDNEEKP